jgi:hypothetical protein
VIRILADVARTNANAVKPLMILAHKDTLSPLVSSKILPKSTIATIVSKTKMVVIDATNKMVIINLFFLLFCNKMKANIRAKPIRYLNTNKAIAKGFSQDSVGLES